MTVYEYAAFDSNQKPIKGRIEADSAKEARAKIKDLGFTADKITATKAGTLEKASQLRALSLNEKIEFTKTFQTLHQAGVPIMEGLIFMGNDASSPRIRAIAKAIRAEILQGNTYAGTIAKYPHIFDKIYIGLTRAGEDTGEMDKTLTRLAALLKKQQETKNKVISALSYPVFVLVLAIVIVLVMVTFVFPKFAEVFESTGKALPPITQACMDLGSFIKGYWFVCIAGTIGAIFGVMKLFEWEPSRQIIDKTLMRTPILQDLVLKSNFSNFLTVLLVAYEAGIPIVDCLHLSSLTLDNYVMRVAMNKATLRVQQGSQLSAAMKSTEITPKMILFMISTGEQTGRLGDLLGNAVEFIDQELDKVIDLMTKMMEPALIIVIGGIVMFMALAFYLPLFGLSAP